MIDLMSPRGRSLALRGVESRLRRLESDIEDRAQPLIRQISEVDNRILAGIGGGVLAIGVIALAAQFFWRSTPKRPAPKTARRRTPARNASRAPRATSKAASNGRAQA